MKEERWMQTLKEPLDWQVIKRVALPVEQCQEFCKSQNEDWLLKKLFIFRGTFLTFFLYFRQLNKRTKSAYWHCYRSPPVLFFGGNISSNHRKRKIGQWHIFSCFFLNLAKCLQTISVVCTKSAAHTHTLPHLLYTFSGLSQPAYSLRTLHCWTRLIYVLATALAIAFEFVFVKIVTKKAQQGYLYVHLRRARTDPGW